MFFLNVDKRRYTYTVLASKQDIGLTDKGDKADW